MVYYKEPDGWVLNWPGLARSRVWHKHCFVKGMILSRTSQYAIQALIYLATRPVGQSVLCRDIAIELGVPSPYLAKVLQNLCRDRLLDSTRGRNGGFSLRRGVENSNLLDIVSATEGHRIERECLLGHKACEDATACPMHRKWKSVKEDIFTCLRGVTLFHLAKAVQSGQYRLADLPQALATQ
jgi:Rrf2 family iron-sulfur cluster assembly transcriptional regulator